MVMAKIDSSISPGYKILKLVVIFQESLNSPIVK